MHRGVEQSVTGPATGLGLVHGGIGVPQQCLGPVAQGDPGGDADAGGDEDGLPGQLEGRLEPALDPAGHRLRNLGISDVRHQHGELVTAQAGEGVPVP
jgi:hypothetical protein